MFIDYINSIRKYKHIAECVIRKAGLEALINNLPETFPMVAMASISFYNKTLHNISGDNMTSAIINFTEENGWMLNIIKARFALGNKSDTVNFIIQKFGKELIEEEVRPEYAKKLAKIRKEKLRTFSSSEEMRRELG